MVTRSEIEAAKKSIQETQQQIETSRLNIRGSREQIQQERTKLKPKKRVPFTPRKTRSAIIKYKGELSVSEQQLKQQEVELAKAEQEVLKYKREVLDPAEAGVKRVEEYNKVVRQLQRSDDKGMLWAHAFYSDGLLGSLARKIMKKRKLIKDYQLKQEKEYYSSKFIDPKTGYGFSMDPALAEGTGYVPYLDYKSEYKDLPEPLPAYYDPITGTEILQSMKPEDVKEKGYLPIELKQYSPSTGKYIAESATGLLTPTQLSFKKLVEAGRLQTQIPTTFEIGGEKEERPMDFGVPLTPYQQAFRKAPYSPTQREQLDITRLSQEDFYSKYKYAYTPEGERITAGTAGSVITLPPQRKKGESLRSWYARGIKDPASTASATKLAILTASLGRLGAGLAGKAFPTRAVAQTTGVALSEPISRKTSEIVDMIVPRSTSGFAPSGLPSQVLRGGLFAGFAMTPLVGPAFGTELLKAGVSKPSATAAELGRYARESPYEVATMFAAGTGRLRRYRINKKSIKLLQSNIKELGKAPLKEVTIIKKGRGLKTGSDRIIINAIQETPTGLRRISIEGDLLVLKGQIYFLPEAAGRAVTISVMKPTKFAASRIYQDIQFFNIGAKSTGINIGKIGDIQLFTTAGRTTYIPKARTYALVKKKFGPYAEARTLRQLVKQMEGKIEYGGTIYKEARLPFQDIGFKINQQVSLLVGKKGIGATFITKKPTKGKVIRPSAGKKTPFRKTFPEQELLGDLKQIAPLDKVSKSIGKQSQGLVNSLVPVRTPSLKGIPRMVGGKGLTQAQMNKYIGPSSYMTGYNIEPYAKTKTASKAQNFSQLLTPTLRTHTSSISSLSQKQKLSQLQKQRQLQKQSQLQKQRQLQKQKQLQKQRQLQKQSQLQKQRQLQKQSQLFQNIIIPRPPPRGPRPPIGGRISDREGLLTPSRRRPKKKKKEKKILPTISQQLIGVKRKRPKEYITGFEIIRA